MYRCRLDTLTNSSLSTLEAAPAWSRALASDCPCIWLPSDGLKPHAGCFAGSGGVGVKLIDLGNCFSVTGTDTSRISFEMQSLPFRAPEVCYLFYIRIARIAYCV